MSEYLAAVLVLVAMIGIMLLMVPGMRRWGHVPKTSVGLAGLLDPESARGFPRGIVGTIALIAGLEHFDGVGVGGYVVAGLLCAALAAARGVVAAIAFQVFGGIGLLAGVAAIVRDDSCTGLPLQWRIAGIVVLALCAALGATGMLLSGRRPKLSLLSVFAATEVLAFLASPLGVSLLNDATWQGWMVVGAAIAFGLLASVAPVAVIGLAAVAASVATLGMSALVGSACGAASDPAGIVGILVFIVAYVLISRFAGRRSRSWR